MVEVVVGSTSFQDGIDGYDGTTDSFITENDITENNGGDRRLLVDGNDFGASGQADVGLFRWANLNIPVDSTVVAASVSLNVSNTGDDFDIQPALRAWEESEATWEQASAGQAWQVPGAGGEADAGPRIGTVVGSRPEFISTSFNADGVNLVRQWLANEEANHGIIISDLVGGATDSMIVDSSEGATNTLHPKLTIFHVPEAALQIAGDLNFDGTVNSVDIDILHAALRQETTDAIFDLDGNGRQDTSDVDFLVNNILRTVRGDLDLDRQVGFADFLLLSASFGDTDHGQWERGDLDGDGRTTFSDFLLMADNFGPV